MNNIIYNKDYFENGIETGKSLYTNYRWIPELTIPLCATIIETLNIKHNERILDFGCAKGYMVKAFRLLHRKCWGFDISNYALKEAPTDVQKYLSNTLSSCFDWIIAKDVLEHIQYENINIILDELKKRCKKMFCIIPLGYGKYYEILAYEYDITHIIKESLQWWVKTFEKSGFEVVSATYKMKHIKENWSQWETGNGFFIFEGGKIIL